MTQQYKAILSLDFDRTIVDSNYTTIHGLRKDAKHYINLLFKEGYYIIINTCRCGDEQNNAENFLKKEDVLFHLINQNNSDLVKFYNADSKKVSADIYVDDKSLENILHPEFLEWKNIYNGIHTVTSSPNFLSSFDLIK